MEDHECGPECVEKAKAYRNARALGVLDTERNSEKKGALLQAARDSIERTRATLEGFTDEQLGQVMEVVAVIVGQIMTTPVYEISDTLADSVTVYTLGSAHLLAGFELPEKAEDLRGIDAPATFAASAVTEDDFRPGNYL
jgi:hypothetical protein